MKEKKHEMYNPSQIHMYVTSDYSTQLLSLVGVFGFVALIEALSIDWTGCVWRHEDYENLR